MPSQIDARVEVKCEIAAKVMNLTSEKYCLVVIGSSLCAGWTEFAFQSVCVTMARVTPDEAK